MRVEVKKNLIIFAALNTQGIGLYVHREKLQRAQSCTDRRSGFNGTGKIMFVKIFM
jgi:hypothetical protein